jgi:hypothetical protein
MKKLLVCFTILSVTLKVVAQPFYSDVAPLFIKHCTSCHHNDMHAPSFATYTQVLQHAGGIEYELNEGAMPPWLPDTTYTRFFHERVITVAEKAAILDWIAKGAQKGDTTLAPPLPHYSKYQIAAAADIEVNIPKFTSKASTTDTYVCFYLPTNLSQDRIIKAFEIVAGNPSIVHHVLVGIDTVGNKQDDLSGNCFSNPGDIFLGGYAPGTEPTIYPSMAPLKMGVRLKAGSKIGLQIHYPEGSAGQMDSTKIRIFFYPVGVTGVRNVYCGTLLQNWTLDIPANSIKTYTASSYIDNTLWPSYDASVFATFPHSHALATYMINYAVPTVLNPGATDTIPLIRIRDWDFNWQGFSTFRKLVKIPYGYSLRSVHLYDNTVNNPHNPNNPPVDVKAGTATKDEMLFDSFQWIKYQKGDEFINIDSLIALDPLVTGITEVNHVNNFKSYAYPNPFESAVNIAYTLDAPSTVSIEIFSIYGTSIKVIKNETEVAGIHEVIWDGKNTQGGKLPSGSYIYFINAGSKQCYGKLTLLPGKN